MMRILSLTKHHCVKRLGIFSITVALFAGMVGCEATPTLQYELTISSTSGGSVTTPEEGASTYDAGTVVSLVAEAEEGYRFVKWIGDVGTIADIDTASTAVTMNGDYSVTARFEETPLAQYRLTILNAGGGSVAEPGEGSFTYDAGTVVDLVATPASDRQFINWTGDVDTVVNVDAASTTVTVNAELFIIANFTGEGFLSHWGGVLDPEGWWYYSVEWNHERDIKWREALFMRSPERFIGDTSEEAPWWGGRSCGAFDGWARVYCMTEQLAGGERHVIVASWLDNQVFEAAVFPLTEQNWNALIYESLGLDGPSGEFYQFVRDTLELGDDVIRGWTSYWE